MTSGATSTFVYVTFIRTTADRLWAALTEPAFTRRYWFGTHLESDWMVGSSWRLVFADGRVADAGQIVEIDPPRRLVLRWRNEFKPELTAEGYSQCKMTLEPIDGTIKLTITHGMDRAASALIDAVSGGWPRILSNLKSLLETGTLAFDSSEKVASVGRGPAEASSGDADRDHRVAGAGPASIVEPSNGRT